jgi:phosphate-selective porin OprO/OprP
VKLEGQRGNMSWQAMGYAANNRTTATGTAESGAGLGIGGRVTWTPIKDKTQLLHLGLSAAKELDAQDFNDRSSNYEMGLADTVTVADFLGRAVDDDELMKYGVEAAYTNGPLTLMAEYLNADLDSSTAGDPSYGGYYVAASYFITGEQRPYKASTGVFDRIKPNDKKGAWEVLARYSETTGEVETLADREISNITLGTTYYFNPQVRFMVNLIKSDIDLGTGTEFDQKALAMRAQFDF